MTAVMHAARSSGELRRAALIVVGELSQAAEQAVSKSK
jgi:hypothetical protein